MRSVQLSLEVSPGNPFSTPQKKKIDCCYRTFNMGCVVRVSSGVKAQCHVFLVGHEKDKPNVSENVSHNRPK